MAISAYQFKGHVVEIHNRRANHPLSTGNKLAFKQLMVVGSFYQHTLQHTYDTVSRLKQTAYRTGDAVIGTPFREYNFTYDLAGNRTNQTVKLNGVVNANVNYSYNTFNQLISDGTNTYTYDANGNLWKTNTIVTHTWDRANRLLNFGGNTYSYNGQGQRIQQQVGAATTNYLLDRGIGLYNVIAATNGANTTRYIHDAMGIHSQENPDGSWNYMLLDGLGSIRGLVDASANILGTRQYDPYGNVWNTTESLVSMPFEYTGQLKDSNGLLHLRARNYNPNSANFISLDPVETVNRYNYVYDNPVNWTDPSGLWCPLGRDESTGRCHGHEITDAVVDAGVAVGRLPGDVSEELGVDRRYADDFSATAFGVAGDVISDASIVPTLILENPSVAAKAIGKWVEENPEDAALAAFAWMFAPAAGPLVLAYGSVGGVTGFTGGYIYGNAMYNMAASGQCGCERQQMVTEMGKSEFVREVAQQGTQYGTLFGMTAGVGWTGEIVAGGAGMFTGSQSMLASGSEMWNNGRIDPCNGLDFLLGAAGVLGSYKLVQKGYNGSSGFRQATNAGRGFYDYVEMLPNGVRVKIRYGINLASNTIDQILYEFDLGTPNLGGGDIPLQAIKHILAGDTRGGGHTGGLGKPNKSEFPPHWNDMRILNAAAEVLTNPNSTIVQQSGPLGSRFTNAGAASRFQIKGIVSGVEITVIWEPTGKLVITAYPSNLPRNP